MLESISDVTNSIFGICVAIFCFLNGYLYYYGSEKTLKHALKKIIRFLGQYWLVFLILAIIRVIAGHQYTFREVLEEMVGLNGGTMCFCWYVYFYCTVMLMMPLLYRLFEKRRIIGFLFGVAFLPYVIGFISSVIPNPMRMVLGSLSRWLPCVSIGYFCAQINLFEKYFEKWILRIKKNTWQCALLILIFFVVLINRWIIPYMIFSINELPLVHKAPEISVSLDILFAPILVFVVAFIDNATREKGWNSILLFNIGKYSMYMWFVHCAFFNDSGEWLKRVLYLPKYPLLVLIWGLSLCYITSFILKRIYEWLLLGIKRLSNFSARL